MKKIAITLLIIFASQPLDAVWWFNKKEDTFASFWGSLHTGKYFFCGAAVIFGSAFLIRKRFGKQSAHANVLSAPTQSVSGNQNILQQQSLQSTTINTGALGALPNYQMPAVFQQQLVQAKVLADNASGALPGGSR